MTEAKKHHVFIVMGVSGSGKSAVASRVAQAIHAAFLDGDFLHPRANIRKMADGHALSDDDRAPWLDRINDAVFAMQRTNSVSIIVCSALKKAYRDRIRRNNTLLSFIFLNGDFDVILARLQARKGHFFKPHMLESQFSTLEAPDETEQDIQTINIHQSLDAVVAETISQIQHIAENLADD